jgi:signal transduction histidine kinase
MFTEFLTKNLDIVFFLYGLVFFTMGIAVFVHPRRGSIFKISDIIWLLALFGLTHGLNEWLDMFDLIKPNDSHLYDLIQLSVLTLSYVFFFEFGRRLMLLSFRLFFLTRWFTIILYFLLFVFIFLFPTRQPSVWPRYFLGFPAGLLTAFGFLCYYRSNKNILRQVNVRRVFLVAAVSAGAYGILGGLITPRAEFFPASIIQNDYFLNLVGIPVQIFRAICALFLAWAVWNILGIFNWEAMQREKEGAAIKAAAEAERKKAQEIEKLYRELEKSHSELKATQYQLIQAEKMEVVGRLASGVAHEVKNPLAIILQGLEYLKQNIHKDDKNAASILKYTEDAVYRADNIIKGLLDFSSLNKLDMKPQDLNSIIENSMLLLKPQLDKYRVRIIKDLGEDLPLVKVDKNKIEQVFVNLILNAIQAIPAGGEISIKTFVEERGAGGRSAVVQIEDDGPGIPENVLEKIFDPFFTTKRDIGGTGMGLTIVRNLIEMHGAKIEIKNKKDGHGIRVNIMFKIQ